MRHFLIHAATATALASALLLVAPAAHAQSFTFQGSLADGPLAGQAFIGSFSVNASSLAPGADGQFPLLNFSMLLVGQTYTLSCSFGVRGAEDKVLNGDATVKVGTGNPQAVKEKCAFYLITTPAGAALLHQPLL